MSSTVLVIDPDVNSAEDVQQILTAEGYEVLSAVTGQAGIVLAELQRPGLILLDTELPDVDGYDVCRALRAIPALARVPILIHSARGEVADKVAGLKAGANDYIVKPVATAELVARIRAALRSERKTLAHIIALWGSKGGVGTTTLAMNLAVALRSRTGKRVTLMDASVLGGTLPVMLNLAPQHTIADLLPRLDQLDSELLASVLVTHSCGIKVLASQPWSQNGSSVHPEQWERILGWLQEANDYIVLDTAPSLDPSTLAMLRLSHPVVVLTPEMTALRNARVFLQAAEAWQLSHKLILVLNRYPIKGGIQMRDIEAALQAKVDVEVPNDEPLVTYSINRGVPLVISHPKSPVARSFYRLANLIIAQLAKKKPTVVRASILPRQTDGATEYRRES